MKPDLIAHMPPTELRQIVDTWGGIDKFAALVGVKPRLVYYWLEGKRNMREATAIMIRNNLKPKDN